MSEVIPHAIATRYIWLYDAGVPVIKKYFCEEHLPSEAVDDHEDD